jgi:hypothetical protein
VIPRDKMGLWSPNMVRAEHYKRSSRESHGRGTFLEGTILRPEFYPIKRKGDTCMRNKIVMVLGVLTILSTGAGCQSLDRLTNTDKTDHTNSLSTVEANPAAPVVGEGLEVVTYSGYLPSMTFVKVPEGGQIGSGVKVYMHVKARSGWIEIPESVTVPEGSGATCYAYDLKGGFGPVVRFMNTAALVGTELNADNYTQYCIFLIRPKVA